MFSVVFYDVRTGQTGDMMECSDQMTRSHFKGIMTNIHMECSYDKQKYQAYVFIGKSLGDVNSMTEFKYPYLLMADIIVTGFKFSGYINIRIKRNTGKNIDFVSKEVRSMRNYSNLAFMCGDIMKLNGFYNRNTYDKYLYRFEMLSGQIAKCRPVYDSSIRWVHNNIVTDTIYWLKDVKNSAREMMGYLECLWDFDLITDQTWRDLTEFYLFLFLECEDHIESLVMGDEVEF